MPKFSKQKGGSTKPVAIKTTELPALTYEGGAGFVRDTKSELFMLAAANFVGENTFYERPEARDLRYRQLVRAVAEKDPEWMQKFIPFLRNRLHMRSASIVAAIEYSIVSPENRAAVIESACVRADEPAEALGYWLNHYGRPIPISVRRGVGRAATNLYTERNALKFDGLSRDVRMADVIELCHPKPKADWQSALFNYLLTTRHGNTPEERLMNQLHMIVNANYLRGLDKDEFLRQIVENADILAEAGMTWEAVSERVPGGMTAQVWEALIPHMGYMALLRNLRNFEEAGVSDEVKAQVAGKIGDSSHVANSRQFPYRFYSAWKFSGSMFFGHALDRALNLSLENVPKLKGRSLILVDQSGSMNTHVGGSRSKVTMMEQASLFGMALAMASEQHRLVYYATDWTAVEGLGPSLLRNVDAAHHLHRQLGGGTNTQKAMAENYGNIQQPHGKFDRVILITDEQMHYSYTNRHAFEDVRVPMYTFNLQGYRTAQHENGVNNKYGFGGLSDAVFTLLPLLESKQAAGWDALFGKEK